MANFNKVIKVLLVNIKSAVSLKLTPLEAQSRQLTLNGILQSNVFVSIALALSTADFIFKTFITLLKLAIGT